MYKFKQLTVKNYCEIDSNIKTENLIIIEWKGLQLH